MINQPADAPPLHHSRRLPLAVAGVGVLLIAGAGLAKSYSSRPLPLPGRLVVKNDLLTWRSPVHMPFRKLGLDEAQAKFEVDNVGGTPVRIVDVETSRGCATPKIEPRIIEAGGVGVVEVKATRR